MIKYIKLVSLSVLIIGLLTGCGWSPTEADAYTKQSLSNPELIGIVRGQQLYRVRIFNPGVHTDHTVYFTDGYPVVTVNRIETQGKTQINRVEVFIDGKSVSTVNVTNKLEL